MWKSKPTRLNTYLNPALITLCLVIKIEPPMNPIVGLIAKKIGMSQMMDQYGQVVAVTLLAIENQQVTKILNPDKHGYTGYQIGYFPKAEKNLNRPDVLRLKKSGVETLYSKFREFRTDTMIDSLSIGQVIDASALAGVTHLNVSSYTKGRGFQGAVKRWNFRIAAMSHGSKYHRRTGSLGNCTTPGRVMPGKKLPGQYGNERRTLKNLMVMHIDQQTNTVAVKGGVPGQKGICLELRIANRKT